MDILKLTHQARECLEAAKFLYGDRWESVKKATRENHLQPHHEANKTTNLLSSAIRLSEGQDERFVLVLLAAALDE